MKSFMNLNRFEAFSDGVFAIAMTLLVIEIKVPDLSQATASTAINALIHTVPHILSYITSFLVIGVLWLNHHALFHLLKRVDRIVLTINLVLLINTSDSFGTGMLREQSQKIPGILTENKKKALFTLSSKNTRTQKNA
jgi:uncharacterized membrane protein